MKTETISPIGCAEGALRELCYPGPFYQQLDCAIWYLVKLRSMEGIDPAIIEKVNDACCQDSTLKERGKAVAQAIEAVFRLYNFDDSLKRPRTFA